MAGYLPGLLVPLVSLVPVVVCGLFCDPTMGFRLDPIALEPSTCGVEFAWALLAGGIVLLDASDDDPSLFHGDDRIYFWSGYVRRIDPRAACFRLLCDLLFVRCWLLPCRRHPISIGQ